MTPTTEEKRLEEKIQKERDRYIELKFQNLDEKMDKMISLLEQNSKKYDETTKRLNVIEKAQENCSINTLKRETYRLRKETAAVRVFGKTSRGYWVTHILVILGILLLVSFMLATIGTEEMLRILTFIK